MKNIIAGIVITSVCFAGVAAAKTVTTNLQQTGVVLVNRSDDGVLDKYYDYDNGVVCYRTYGNNSTPAISCLK